MINRTLYKGRNITTILILLVFMFLPLFVSIYKEDNLSSEKEKRKLANLPAMPESFDDIRKFPDLFDKYYSDNFGLRNYFLNYFKHLKFKLGDAPTAAVTIGKDGWLFLGSIKKGGNIFHDPIGDAMNTNLYSSHELRMHAKYIIAVHDWLMEKGIKYVFVIAPSKHSIYFDKLPDYITKLARYSATDQLVNYLGAHTQVPVVDLREPLLNEKNNHPLYYVTGTHWNFLGGNIAQYVIMQDLKKMFPEKISPTLYDYPIFEYHEATDRGLEKAAGIEISPIAMAPYPVFEPGTSAVFDTMLDNNGKSIERKTHTVINEANQIDALIYHDSFFKILKPYFTRKLRHSTLVWHRITYGSLNKQIKLRKPDIVIEQWVERILPFTNMKYDEFLNRLHQRIYSGSKFDSFSVDFQGITQNECLNEINDVMLKYRIICSGAKFFVRHLPLSSDSEYVLNIKLTSPERHKLELSYIDADNSTNRFNMNIKKGSNNLYIPLDYPNQEHNLTVALSKPGTIALEQMELRKVPPF